MERFSIISFLSDFGWRGGYTAACEAVLVGLCPHARVMHLSHEVAVGDVRDGATTLARVAPALPPSLHLAVVDPGVGTTRRPLVLQADRGDLLVGPDNGLLMTAVEALGGLSSAWCLQPDRVRASAGLPAQGLSHTFHGRDLFAPAAALLAAGAPVTTIAEPVPGQSLTTLPPSFIEITPDSVRAEVVEIDRYGNIGLAARVDHLPGSPDLIAVEVEGEPGPAWIARIVTTFADLKSGELGLYEDSWGSASLALNGASAAEQLGAATGMVVRLATHR